LEATWRAKTIGPTLPSLYLDDGRLPSNRTYGFNLSSANTDPSMVWLDKQAPSSVVLASYGTVAHLDAAPSIINARVRIIIAVKYDIFIDGR
jgi:hypothetical protein